MQTPTLKKQAMMWSSLIAALVLSATALGHAQTEEKRKAHSAALHRIATHSKRSLAACAETPAAVELRQRAVARRAAWANELRRSRGLTTRKSSCFVCLLMSHFFHLSSRPCCLNHVVSFLLRQSRCFALLCVYIASPVEVWQWEICRVAT